MLEEFNEVYKFIAISRRQLFDLRQIFLYQDFFTVDIL